MKSGRQDAIKKIISENEIETQNQLLEELEKIGIRTTQATLSRDIKNLQLTKSINSNNKYVYILSPKKDDASLSRLMKIFRECVISYDNAQNIIVIKTLPGLAGAACSAFDNMNVQKLVGSIAGDDTAFLLFKDTESADEFLNKINSIL
ncbi:MAG: arginine repressor [Oscillospiraceae bacterium]|nr:arginine repressor [Oscillospiraceae bacterium]